MTDQHGYLYDLFRKLGLSDFGARTAEFLLVRPLTLVIILVVAIIGARVAARATRRFVRSVHHRSPLRPPTPRSEQRSDTIADVAASFVRGVILAIAFLIALDQLGVNLAPLLAGAGIAGLAIGFGAQTLVRDVLSGLFVIIEDQYGIGDIVTLGDSTGTVEDVGLRVTRIRSNDGTVWFIPNGEVRRVGNASMEWSRALIDVLVAYDADVTKAMSVIDEEARAMAADPAWSSVILEPPEVWGVQAMTADGLTIRLVVKTAPREHYAVARELRGRISTRLRHEGIKGPGQSVLVTAGALDQGPPPPPPEDVSLDPPGP